MLCVHVSVYVLCVYAFVCVCVCVSICMYVCVRVGTCVVCVIDYLAILSSQILVK